MTLDDLSGHTSFYKIFWVHNVDILEKFEKDWALTKKIYRRKDDFEILR